MNGHLITRPDLGTWPYHHQTMFKTTLRWLYLVEKNVSRRVRRMLAIFGFLNSFGYEGVHVLQFISGSIPGGN